MTAAPMIMKAGLRSSAVRWTSQVATSGVSPPTMPKVVLKPSAIVVQRAAGGVVAGEALRRIEGQKGAMRGQRLRRGGFEG